MPGGNFSCLGLQVPAGTPRAAGKNVWCGCDRHKERRNTQRGPPVGGSLGSCSGRLERDPEGISAMRSVALAGFRDVRRIFRCSCRDAVDNRDALHILLTRDRGTAERFRQAPAGQVLLGTGCRQGICRALSPSLGIALPGTRMQFKRKRFA